jgi:nucleoside-diphosphate-sugar epimerase
MNIALLGANSHIAKGLVCNFQSRTDDTLYLFTRAKARVYDFMKSAVPGRKRSCTVKEGYKDFKRHHYDVIINCVGAGTPQKLADRYSDWFMLTEKFDNLIIDYMLENTDTLYINFSSGAVYGRNLDAPAGENSLNCLAVNHIRSEEYYSIANLNAEAKHRSFKSLTIIDLRIFSYFSRFIDLGSGYFITELLNCVKHGKVLRTSADNILRDYIHPDDLFSLIMQCMRGGSLNAAFDAFSREPVEKFQVLDYFTAKYGLKYEVDRSLSEASPNGARNTYCSHYTRAEQIGYKPLFTSMDAIREESTYIL